MDEVPPDGQDGARGRRRLVAEVLGVAVGCVAVATLLTAAPVTGTAAYQLVTLAAAAAGGGAAILAVLGSRLAGERGPAWFAAGLFGYGVILLPWAALVPAATLAPPERLARWLAYLVALVLLVLSLRPPRRCGTAGGWVVLGVGGLLAVTAQWLPVDAVVLFAGPVPDALIQLGWTGAAVGYVIAGARHGDPARLRTGLGLTVLAAAQLYRVAVSPDGGSDLVFAGLRLLGLVVVLVGLAHGVQRALAALRRQQEELTAAALQRERSGELAAERDHELRNGLAGLAGITHLISTDGREHEPLKHAVLAELSRLHLILDGPADAAGHGPADPAVDYAVEPLLNGLVTLRRSEEDRVRLRVERGLRARGRSAALAQVMTNLLANCDRHAPGAAVTVEAYRAGAEVVITVRDEGQGLSGSIVGSVLNRGVRDESAGGSGLGLHISRQLIAREGGTLDLRDVTEPPGCLATVTVPAAETTQRHASSQVHQAERFPTGERPT